jgi:hypothetical protein
MQCKYPSDTFLLCLPQCLCCRILILMLAEGHHASYDVNMTGSISETRIQHNWWADQTFWTWTGAYRCFTLSYETNLDLYDKRLHWRVTCNTVYVRVLRRPRAIQVLHIVLNTDWPGTIEAANNGQVPGAHCRKLKRRTPVMDVT